MARPRPAVAVTVAVAVGFGGAVLALSHLRIRFGSRGRVLTDGSEVAARVSGRVAVVLGAGLRPDGTPTGVLARRVDAAVELHRAGLVERVVMSGAADGNGDQPAAMAAYALARGVPEASLALDHDGVDTAATCRSTARANAGQPVVLVTQRFHAPRAAYLAARAGLDAVVLATPDAEVLPVPLRRARMREVPAALKAVLVDDPRALRHRRG